MTAAINGLADGYRKSKAAGQPTEEGANAAGDFITTAIQIPRAVHQLLRQMAVEQAARQGGRVSVSGVLAEMALERETSSGEG